MYRAIRGERHTSRARDQEPEDTTQILLAHNSDHNNKTLAHTDERPGLYMGIKHHNANYTEAIRDNSVCIQWNKYTFLISFKDGTKATFCVVISFTQDVSPVSHFLCLLKKPNKLF